MDQNTAPPSSSAPATNNSVNGNAQIPKPEIINTTPPVTSETKPKGGGNKLLVMVFVIGALLLGAIAGFSGSYLMSTNKQASNIEVNKDTGEIILPADAVQIQSCSDRRGKLFVKPADIPVGPVYMVNNGKVIGIEYMLSKDEFLAGKSYSQLAGNEVKVNHVNIGLLSQGHEGYESPHFHVDMYTIPSSEADTIVCPKNPNATPTATSSAEPATSSAKPATSSASPSAKSATPSGQKR